jgi:MFS family permease
MVLIRLMQGFSVGGQLVGSIVFAAEESPRGRETGITAIVLSGANIGTMFGAVVATLCHAIFSEEQLVHWAWRIPFVLGFVLSILAYVLQRGLRPVESTGAQEYDTPSHAATTLPGEASDMLVSTFALQALTKPVSPLKAVLGSRAGRRKLLACFCGYGVHSACFYVTFIFMPTFDVSILDLSATPSFALTVCGMFVTFTSAVLLARYADKSIARITQAARIDNSIDAIEVEREFGVQDDPCATRMSPAQHIAHSWRARLLWWAFLALIPLAPVLFYIEQFAAYAMDGAVDGPQVAAAWIAASFACLGMVIIEICITSVISAWMVDLFPPPVRFSAMALALNLATVVFGGSAPVICETLASRSPRYSWTAGLFLSCVGALGILGLELGDQDESESASDSLVVAKIPSEVGLELQQLPYRTSPRSPIDARTAAFV